MSLVYLVGPGIGLAAFPQGIAMAQELRELSDGSAAIVRGALAAGCNFFAGYPITPASSILAGMLRELPPVGGVAIQAEDEIAAIGICIGAAMTGARAMTATSGPGLSLYSENVGLAVMGEVPLVIVDVQRLGPATGGATTVGQGDVQFARWGTSGGYPVIVLAPSSLQESYELTIRAFRLAERFRCPVFLLTDKELALTLNTVTSFPQEAPPVKTDGLKGEAVVSRAKPPRPADQVSALLPIGGDVLVRFTGSTHGEDGLLTKDPAKVRALNQHLAAKIEDHRDEIELVVADLQPGARTLLLSYGVTAGAMREAVHAARSAGRRVSCLTLQSLWPVPEDALAHALERVEQVIVAELNLGEYRREIERIAPRGVPVEGLNRVDGELITPQQFLDVIG
jgi:2-oxoglutarate ferredoxin oxidoreductase subunit alpha